MTVRMRQILCIHLPHVCLVLMCALIQHAGLANKTTATTTILPASSLPIHSIGTVCCFLEYCVIILWLEFVHIAISYYNNLFYVYINRYFNSIALYFNSQYI